MFTIASTALVSDLTHAATAFLDVFAFGASDSKFAAKVLVIYGFACIACFVLMQLLCSSNDIFDWLEVLFALPIAILFPLEFIIGDMSHFKAGITIVILSGLALFLPTLICPLMLWSRPVRLVLALVRSR